MTEDSEIPSIKLKTGTNSGPTWGGTKVDILVEGLEGFDEDTVLFSTVKFGEIEAPKPYQITKKNDGTVTEFRVFSPPGGAGKVNITLITPGGTVITRRAAVSSVQPHPELVPVIISGNYFKETKVEAVYFGDKKAIWHEVRSESEIWALAAEWAISDPVILKMTHDTAEDDTTFTYNDPAPTPTGRSPTAGARRKRVEVEETDKAASEPTAE